MTGTAAWVQSWRAFGTLRKRHPGPPWARCVIASSMALLAWAALCALGMAGIVTVEVPDTAFLYRLATGVLLLFLVIAWTMLAVVRLVEWLLPETTLAALSPASSWRSATAVSLVLLAGLMLGNLLGSALLSILYPANEMFTSSALRRQLRFLQFLPFLAVVNGIFWRLRLQRQALNAQAAEAELRLLHAQIEPHFLFNTLATIESLLDADPVRARAMLEAFSDHLRAGLAQLRTPITTLGAELDMAANYLRLLQIRMGERLHFSVHADAAARSAPMPSLLLQPLVENAIRHGLEPQIAGGCVRIHASVAAGRLCIRVEDDGAGLHAPASRAGSGMALENIRARLRHRYGSAASLALDGGTKGTTATIDLPCP